MKLKETSEFPSPTHPIVKFPQRWFILATLAIIGKIIMLTSAWLLPFASEFSLISDHISELVLGSYGFVQTAAFVISGLTTLGLAFAIRKFTIRLWPSLIGSILVGIYGIGGILAAIFPTDRVDSAADLETLSKVGAIHVGVAIIAILSMVVGMFILTWNFRRQVNWQPFIVGFVLCSGSTLALFFAQTQGHLAGLMQRLLITAISLWLILVAVRVRLIAALYTNTSNK